MPSPMASALALAPILHGALHEFPNASMSGGHRQATRCPLFVVALFVFLRLADLHPLAEVVLGCSFLLVFRKLALRTFPLHRPRWPAHGWARRAVVLVVLHPWHGELAVGRCCR